MTDETAGVAAYICVTVTAGDRCADLALPAALPVADLMPGVVRLLAPSGGAAADADRDSTPRRHLTPIGRPPLDIAESLDAAGIVDGDVLMLTGEADRPPVPVIGTVRDVVEQGVQTAYAAWDTSTTRQWARWTVLSALLGLLIPVTVSPSPTAAAIAVSGAAIAGVLAVQAGRDRHFICGAMGVVTAALYAAGAVAVWHWSSAQNAAPEMVVLPALGAGLVAVVLIARCWRPAVVATAAVGTAVMGAAAAALARWCGADAVTAALTVAVAMVLILGALPRAVLAASGLIRADAHDERLGEKLEQAERWLAGCLIGATGAAVAGVLPAVATGDRGRLLLVAGIGCLMLLRARAFTLVCHTIGARVGGTLVLATVWWVVFRDAPSTSRAALLLGTVAALAALLVAQSLAGTERAGPVTTARVDRALDVAEWLLVVAVLVGTAAQVGLASWATTVLG